MKKKPPQTLKIHPAPYWGSQTFRNPRPAVFQTLSRAQKNLFPFRLGEVIAKRWAPNPVIGGVIYNPSQSF